VPLEAGLSPRPFWLEITLQDGGVQRHRVGAEDGTLAESVALDGRRLVTRQLPLPRLPRGRHRIVRDDAPDHACALTVAPATCYLPQALAAGKRRFGVAAQLYALRSGGDQGIGDFSTLRELGAATAAAGGSVVGLNPLHALFPADRTRASPYNPSDRRFLEPIYLDLSALDDGLPPAAESFAGTTATDVDYPRVWAVKSAFLRQRFAAFATWTEQQPDCFMARDFAEFIRLGGPELRGFAIFQVISELQKGQSWPFWPVEFRDPASIAVANIGGEHAADVRYHQYLQWQCDRQLARAARDSGLEIGLIRDLAVGSAPDGAEAWAGAGLLATGVSIGAPPDPFAKDGQVWSLPPPVPLRMAEDGYASFAALVENNLRHAGGLRIDHVMGLSRLFWVPDGARGGDGTYVNAPLDDLLGHLALASQNAQALVVGEDLGTVPFGLRGRLAENDILSYRVLLLEREGHDFLPQSAYPSRAMACVSTHDLPTMAGWWQGADISERQALGQISDTDGDASRVARQAERIALTRLLDADLETPLADLAADAHGFVAGTAADLAMVQVDDLALEPAAVNLPGTNTERSNWRRRLATPVADLFETPTAQAMLGAMRKGDRSV